MKPIEVAGDLGIPGFKPVFIDNQDSVLCCFSIIE